MNKPRQTPWTDERIEQLIALQAQGISNRAIAAMLGGVSRNAVISKLHRLNIDKFKKPMPVNSIDISAFGPNSKTSHIIAWVASRHQIRVDDLLLKMRCGPIPRARMEISWYMRNFLSYSYPQIGRIMGRHHTTIINGVDLVQKELDEGRSWQVINKNYVYGPFHPRLSMSSRAKIVAETKRIKAQLEADQRKRAFTAARKQAKKINDFWAPQGVDAQATPVMIRGRIVIRSSLSLVSNH